ncbi:MAG: cytidylate kinase family protein [Patescibacteria group bacterium]
MIVTISGKPGSGKSTVAERLAADLGYKRYYVGAMWREAARARGMNITEFGALANRDSSIDIGFEKSIEELGQREDNFVIESRTAWHFIPHSIKVFIDVSDDEGAKRIWGALQKKNSSDRSEEKHLTTLAAVLESVRDRISKETIRYQKYYGIDIFDRVNYDLFLDATTLDQAQEYQAVYSFVKKHLKKN